MVRDALRNPIPPARKKPARPHWKLKSFIALIESMLEADLEAPRKQRHTAHRVWQRLRKESRDFGISERMIRRVRDLLVAKGLDRKAVRWEKFW